MARQVWFQLIDHDGNDMASVDCIDCADDATLLCLRDSVKEKIKASRRTDLIFYANRATYDDENGQPLEEDSPIGALGESNTSALLVKMQQLPGGEEADLRPNKRQKVETLGVIPFDTPLSPCLETARAFEFLKPLTMTSHFQSIREKGYFYVDKTKVLLDLVSETSYQHVFLHRPRRFGKTLVVSVLEHLFLGHEALFKGLYAEHHWDWKKKSPVLRFDLSGMHVNSFREGLHSMILLLSNTWGFKNEEPTSSSALTALIQDLFRRYGPCVVLVDEYDKPVIGALESFGNQVAAMATQDNLDCLRAFYETIKSLGNMIRFSYVTGSSRLARSCIDTARKDISFEPAFNELCGFTEDELQPFLAHSSLQWMDLKHMYNGYQFGGNTRLYNPFGLVCCFAEGKIDSYWVDSGCLASGVLKLSNPHEIFEILSALVEDQDILIHSSELHQNYDALVQNKVPLVPLLLQAGYLSLREQSNDTWSLRVPNEEVRLVIPELFWLALSKKIDRYHFWATIREAISVNDIDVLYDSTYKLVTCVGAPVSADATFYKCVFQVAFQAAKGVECQVECRDSHDALNLDALHLVLTSNSCRIGIELKLVDPRGKTKEEIHRIACQALEQARRDAAEQPAEEK